MYRVRALHISCDVNDVMLFGHIQIVERRTNQSPPLTDTNAHYIRIGPTKKKRIRNAKREAGEFSMRRIEAEPNFVEIYDDKFIHTMHMLHMHL